MRHKQTPKRDTPPDSRYGRTDVAKFINFVMMNGKKTLAEKCVYGAFELVEKSEKKPTEIFEQAVANTTPQMEVRSRRVGGANYQIPMPVRGERQRTLSFRWIRMAARNRKGHSMAEKLAAELMDAAQGLGDAVKKKQDMHRMAEANRAFAHFARIAR